jgi:hypothetical protein
VNDRELVELAAKAAGVKVSFDRVRRDWGWNPLDNDGDALRLAVKLKLMVCIGWDNPTLVSVEWIERSRDGNWRVREYEGAQENDIYEATRRAIVRAAAEIGREEQ